MRPEVYDWLKKRFDYFVHLGVKGYKIDRGEEGEMPRSVENQHVILLNKLAAEGMAAVNGSDFFNFSRNANDTSRKYTAVWNGDTQPTLRGLAVSVKGLLRSGAINFPMWGSDTGGYLGPPDKELMARWLEFSAYSPMMEVLAGSQAHDLVRLRRGAGPDGATDGGSASRSDSNVAFADVRGHADRDADRAPAGLCVSLRCERGRHVG